MIKKTYIFLLLTIGFYEVDAQKHAPVKWSTGIIQISDTKYDLMVVANIDDGWYIYSQDIPEKSPNSLVPTIFYWEANNHIQFTDPTKERQGLIIDDPIFGVQVKCFETYAVFKQRIVLTEIEAANVDVNVNVLFTASNNLVFLPPTEVDLVFSIK